MFPKGWRDESLASRLRHAEAFEGFPPAEPHSNKQPFSLMQVAAFTAIKATGGPWDPFTQTEEGMEAMRKQQTQKAAGKVLIVRDVPYVRTAEREDVHKQKLDIYLPMRQRGGLAIVVHFHGGGWVDGDRDDETCGTPAVARSHAAAGCVVVAPSYRLGECKALMADAQRAVLWAVANATALGADPHRLYLSGHSAGGNIAALLGLGPWLAPPILPPSTVKGVIGISGVYCLVRPLGGLFAGYKNEKIFDQYMRLPVFGNDATTLARYSPTALLRLGLGHTEPFKPKLSELLGKLAQDVTKQRKKATHLDSVSWAEEVPPFVLVNASWDVGLEDDAAYFAKLLKARTGTKPMHHSIPNTNHYTVTWDERCFRHCRDFIAACEASPGRSERDEPRLSGGLRLPFAKSRPTEPGWPDD